MVLVGSGAGAAFKLKCDQEQNQAQDSECQYLLNTLRLIWCKTPAFRHAHHTVIVAHYNYV